jgi:hypothetical protein
MKRYVIAAITALSLSPAFASNLEIPATPKLIEAAKALPICDRPGCINSTYDSPAMPVRYHFREYGNMIWVCAVHWGANSTPCVRTPLNIIHKIDVLAEDICQHDPAGGVPHAITGEAIVLNYQCKGKHMTREAYAYHFDSDGYKMEEWKPMTP